MILEVVYEVAECCERDAVRNELQVFAGRDAEVTLVPDKQGIGSEVAENGTPDHLVLGRNGGRAKEGTLRSGGKVSTAGSV